MRLADMVWLTFGIRFETCHHGALQCNVCIGADKRINITRQIIDPHLSKQTVPNRRTEGKSNSRLDKAHSLLNLRQPPRPLDF
jgi:hypothetical protein